MQVEYLERALAFEVSQRGKLVQAELEQQAEIEKRTADYSMLVAAELANGTSLQNSTLTALAAERDFRVQQYAAQLAAARQVFNAHNYSAPGATIAKVAPPRPLPDHRTLLSALCPCSQV